MEKIHFSIDINAPVKKVWDTMLDDVTYRQWTKPFNAGSYYEGSWQEGAEILFLGSDENGNTHSGGMYSRIKENRLYEFICIEHLGMVSDGVIDTTSDEVKQGVPAFEQYSFKENAGVTTVSVECDVSEGYKAEFETMWPAALVRLKELAEK